MDGNNIREFSCKLYEGAVGSVERGEQYGFNI